MKNVKRSFLLILCLILSFSYQGSADCPTNVKHNTWWEAITGKEWVKQIKVQAIKGQGIDGYFNPKIRVCDYGGKSNCYDLEGGKSCRQIYGTQATGAGVSAAAFIDWEGDKTSINAEIAEGLGWEWADGVTDEEKIKFANSPKICACSQKAACMMKGSVLKYAPLLAAQIVNIFTHQGNVKNLCDACYQTKVKCAPIPLAPGPPPFCRQLEMSSTQVRIVPIADKDNDYFDPRVKVIVGNLKEQDGSIGQKLNFPDQYGRNNSKKHNPVLGKDGVEHYFKTYREKNKLCAEYHGTKGIDDDDKNLQFKRCFPSPAAPEPQILEIASGELQVKVKMNSDTCNKYGNYSHGFCTFSVGEREKRVGPFFFQVVKPAIVEQIPNNKNEYYKVLEKILGNNEQFKILGKYSYTPNILVGCSGSTNFYKLADFNQERLKECPVDNLGQPEIEVRYEKNANSKMLCLSGWKPDPEEFILNREGEDKINTLKLMGASYSTYDTVYSRESNQVYYFPRNKLEDLLLTKIQSELDEMIFNRKGYVSIPEENKRRSNCSVKSDSEMDVKDKANCKLAYELIDGEHKESCNNDREDGCICFDNACSRSTQYVDKYAGKKDKQFYLRYEEVSYEENGKRQNALQLKDRPHRVNRSEVFYADKLCRFDLSALKEKVRSIIIRQLNERKEKLESKNEKPYGVKSSGYTDDLSDYKYVEIEAWGGGEAGHIAGQAGSQENRIGMAGDYIKAKLEIDSNYPVIQVKVTEGGGGYEGDILYKDGGPTIIKMCKDKTERDCQDLITAAGGGKHKRYGQGMQKKETKVHRSLKQGETQDIKIVKVEDIKDQDKKVAYIENGMIKYESVRCDNLDSNNANSSSKHGAGGCIDKNGRGKNYSKGASGYAKVKPILGEIDKTKINDVVEKLVDKLESIKNINIDDKIIKVLDSDIIRTIEQEIRKELLTG